MNKRGAMFIEYAMVLAFVIAVGVAFHDLNFHKSIDNIFTRAEYLLEGKKGIFTSDDFFTAVQKSEPQITYNGTTYNSVYDYIKDKVAKENYSFTSGSIDVGWNNGVDSYYKNGSEPVHDALEKSQYAGHENITWSIIGGRMYVYEEGKLNVKDHANQKFTVNYYDVQSGKNLGQKTVTFVESKNGYGYLKP